MRSVEVLPVKGYCFYVLELVINVYQMAICGCANLFIHSFFWLGACLICLLCLLLFIHLVGGPLCVSLDIRTCLRVPQFFGCSSRLLWFMQDSLSTLKVTYLGTKETMIMHPLFLKLAK